jgi:hypothetical protein
MKELEILCWSFNFEKTILGGSWVGVFQRIKEPPVPVISKTLKN